MCANEKPTWLQHKAGRLDVRLTRLENRALADEMNRLSAQVEQLARPDDDTLEAQLDDLILRQHDVQGIVRGWAPCNPDTMTVAISPDAPHLVRFAAEELCRYLTRLFGGTPRCATYPDVQPGKNPLIMLGCGDDRDWMNELCEQPTMPVGEDIPSPQGYFLHSRTEPYRLVIAGSEPVGVLYGVYELIERLGVVFQITGDIFPDDPGPCRLPDMSVVRKPFLTIRGLADILNMACVEHSETEFKSLLDQMAKLRYNLFMIGFFYRTDPEVSFEYRGLGTPTEACTERQAMLNRVFEHARRRGIRTAIGYYLQHLQGTGDPGAPDDIYRPCIDGLREAFPGWSAKPNADWRDVTDPVRHDIERQRFDQIRGAYPGVDFVMLFSLEMAHPLDHPDCQALSDRYRDEFGWQPETLPIRGYAGHNGRLMELHLLREAFLRDPAVRRSALPTRLVYMACFMDRYLPLAGALMPDDMICMGHTAYSTWPLTDTIDDLEHLGRRGTYERWVWDCLGYDMIQDFPQAAAWANWIMMRKAARYGVTGMPLNYWRLRGYEHLARYFAEVSWNPTVTPPAFYRDYVARVFGVRGEGIDRLVRAFSILEDHTRRLMSPWSETVDLDHGGLHLSPHWPQIQAASGAAAQPMDYAGEAYSPASLEALRQVRELCMEARSTVDSDQARKRLDRFIEEELDRCIGDGQILNEYGDRMMNCREQWEQGLLSAEEANQQIEQLLEEGVTRFSRNPWWPTHHRYFYELARRLRSGLER